MGNVTKKDLIEKISQKTNVSRINTKIIFENLLKAISTSLEEKKNIEIRGFGRFKVKERKARLARNPRTGDTIQVEKGVKPIFEGSRELKKKINKQE